MQLLSNNIKLQDRDSRPAYLELLWVGLARHQPSFSGTVLATLLPLRLDGAGNCNVDIAC